MNLSQPACARALVLSATGALLFSACEKPAPAPVKPPEAQKKSVMEMERPANDAPPVNAVSYDEGYMEGMRAGEAAGRAVPPRTKLPATNEIEALALQAAGTDSAKGPRWQRGYASGYKDGYERIAFKLR